LDKLTTKCFKWSNNEWSKFYTNFSIEFSRQISDIVVGQEDNMTAREALLRWARRSTARYPGVRVNDFTGSWRDGLAFSALIHRNRPDLIDWRDARTKRTRERLETAFHVVEKEYGVTRLLDPEGEFFHYLFVLKITQSDTYTRLN
jgi:hypothetical protein